MVQKQTLNRTILELKHATYRDHYIHRLSLNRTILELKHFTASQAVF